MLQARHGHEGRQVSVPVAWCSGGTSTQRPVLMSVATALRLLALAVHAPTIRLEEHSRALGQETRLHDPLAVGRQSLELGGVSLGYG